MIPPLDSQLMSDIQLFISRNPGLRLSDWLEPVFTAFDNLSSIFLSELKADIYTHRRVYPLSVLPSSRLFEKH